jgi:hypothetical protein
MSPGPLVPDRWSASVTWVAKCSRRYSAKWPAADTPLLHLGLGRPRADQHILGVAADACR